MSNFSLVFFNSSSRSFFLRICALSSSSINLFASSRFLNFSVCRLNSLSLRLACSTLSCSSPILLSWSSLVDCLSLISFYKIRIFLFCSAVTLSNSAFSASVASKRANSSLISLSLSCQSLPGNLTCTRLKGVVYVMF